jgi:hypothetical protein
VEATSSEDKSRRGSGSKLLRLMTALVAALAASAAGTALATPEPVSPAPQASENCGKVQERLRAHGSGGQTTLCAQTATPRTQWTVREVPRASGRAESDPAGGVSARGLRPDPAPRAVPRYCPTRLDAIVTAGRFRSCAKSLVTYFELDNRGVVIGRATFAGTFWAQLRPRARSWVYNLKLNGFRGTGTLAGGFYLAASGRCIGGCRIYAARPPDGTLARLGPGAPVQGSWTMGSPGRRTLSHRFNAVLTAYVPGAVNGARASFDYLNRTRCDSASYLQSSGCVYPVNPGLFRLSAAPGSGVTQAAAFYRDAQQSLPNHAGRLDGPPLRRTRNVATIRANRAAARRRCATLLGPRPPDRQCDEYPFASARSTTSAFRVRYVVDRQNERVGGLLGNFYREQRILDRDTFYAQIVG